MIDIRESSATSGYNDISTVYAYYTPEQNAEHGKLAAKFQKLPVKDSDRGNTFRVLDNEYKLLRELSGTPEVSNGGRLIVCVARMCVHVNLLKIVHGVIDLFKLDHPSAYGNMELCVHAMGVVWQLSMRMD